MSSDEVMIEACDVGKDYLIFEKPSHRLWQMLFRGKRNFFRAHTVLRNISFKVRRGETVGLVGRNGSGKSTLLAMICGTLPASTGEVIVNGRVAALLELGAGFNPEISGLENIDLCAQIYGLTVEQVHQRRQSIVDFADIGDYIHQPVKTYSSGMFTRLAFSVVAHVDADILVIDEALAVGDAYFVQKCMRFLAGFKEKGGTLLFVSHDMGAISSLCDRAIWLRDQGVVMDAAPKEIANAYLADLYHAQQGEAAPAAVTAANASDDELESLEIVDPRLELLRNSNLRNDIEIVQFEAGHDFGLGGAVIEMVTLNDSSGRPLSWIIGGESVRLTVTVSATTPLRSPIVGFVVKDRLGQPLFGDNTHLFYMDAPVSLQPGARARATFEFQMPILARGTYSLSVAIADGSQADHVVHQWLHEAVMLASRSTSLATGLIGIPMKSVSFQTVPGNGEGGCA